MTEITTPITATDTFEFRITKTDGMALVLPVRALALGFETQEEVHQYAAAMYQHEDVSMMDVVINGEVRVNLLKKS